MTIPKTSASKAKGTGTSVVKQFGTGVSDGRPHKYAAKTPDGIARQQGNLAPATAHLLHGAYSAAKLAPETKRVLSELTASFPSVSPGRREIAAHQGARIALLREYVNEVGVIRNRQRGETFPAVALLQREEASFRVELGKLEEIQRAAAVEKPGAALEQYLAHLAATDDGGDR